VHVITRSNEHEVMRLAWIRACMAAVSAKVMAWEVSDWLEWGTIPVIRAESSVWQYRSIASVVVATHVSMRPGILRTMVVMFWGAYRPHSLPQDKRESRPGLVCGLEWGFGCESFQAAFVWLSWKIL
jgi:hypothetical protein